MSENASTGITQDERVLAALAHAGVIIPMWGMIGAIVVWVTQREKSRFVAFQALQGAVYQLTLFLCAFVGFACYLCTMFGTFPLTFVLAPFGVFIGEAAESPETGGALGGLVAMLTMFFPLCILGLVILIGLAYVLYGLYGALRVLQGYDFRYAVIGRRLEEYLNRQAPAV